MLGILLSRVLSGFISEHYGWRMVFVFAIAMISILLGLTHKMLPNFERTTTFTYRKLMLSLFELIAKHRELRVVTASQALLAISFSAFWSTLAILLKDSFNLGPEAAGAFGLAGAAGALAATLGGRMSDKYGSLAVSYSGPFIAVISFALIFLFDSITPSSRFMLLIVSAVGFDFGIQASLVAHQTIMYGIDLNARSRLNAIFATDMFIGMAVGSVVGGYFYEQFQLRGLAAVMMGSSLAAIILKLYAGWHKTTDTKAASPKDTNL